MPIFIVELKIEVAHMLEWQTGGYGENSREEGPVHRYALLRILLQDGTFVI